MAIRLKTIGTRIYLPDGVTEFVPRGFNDDQYFNVGDAVLKKAAGANINRITPNWYSAQTAPYGASGANDLYNSTASNYLDPTVWAYTQAQMAEPLSQNIWSIIGLSGENGDFYTNPTIVNQFVQSWQQIARTYVNTDYIAAYELITEPSVHRVGDTPGVYDIIAASALIEPVYYAAAYAIRAIDPNTPIIMGPPTTYDCRNLPSVFSARILALGNVWATFDWYEIGAGSGGGYVRQTKGGKNGATGYPFYYKDQKGTVSNCIANYPGKGQTVYMDRTWLTGLRDVIVKFRTQLGIPVFANQVGIRSNVPNSFQWAKDVIDMLTLAPSVFGGTAGSGPIGFIVWAWYSGGKNDPGFNGLSIYWNDQNGNIIGPKNGVINSIANGGDGNNWLGMFSSRFSGYTDAVPPPSPVACIIRRDINNPKNIDLNLERGCDNLKGFNLSPTQQDALFVDGCALQLVIKATDDLNASVVLNIGLSQDQTITGIVFADDYLTSGNFDVNIIEVDVNIYLTQSSYYYELQMIYANEYFVTYFYGNLNIVDGV